MPRSMGDSTFHVSRFHYLVPVATPVLEYVHPATEERVVEQIARYIGGIIEDGSTLQIGLGRVTSAALKYLSDRNDIGIHSDVITDAIIPLLEKGVLTGRRKTSQRDKIVTSFAIGTKRLYDLIDRNPLFCFQPIDIVANTDRHRRTAPDGLGDAGVRDRPHRPGVRGPVARRVLCRPRGAGRIPARRVPVGRGQGHHLPRLDGGRRQRVHAYARRSIRATASPSPAPTSTT